MNEAPQQPPTTSWWNRPVPLWATVVIAVVAMAVGAAAASGDGGDADDEEVASASPVTTDAEDVQEDEAEAAPEDRRRTTTTQRQRRTTTTTTTRPTTTTSEAPTTTAPPQPGFGGGTQIVGTDIEPGVYITTDVSWCYWERLSGLSGEFDDIIVNDNVSGQAIIDIAPGDAAFNSQRCGRWERYEAPAEPVEAFGEGDWVVGEQIRPGTYRAEVESWCYWARASGFGHGFTEIIANDNVQEGNAIVQIAPTDLRFSSSGCGTWRPM